MCSEDKSHQCAPLSENLKVDCIIGGAAAAGRQESPTLEFKVRANEILSISTHVQTGLANCATALLQFLVPIWVVNSGIARQRTTTGETAEHHIV
jgi:hypothetical protein